MFLGVWHKGFMFLLAGVLLLISGCGVNKNVAQGEYYLSDVKVISTSKDLPSSEMEPYLRQKSNTRWFSLFKIPMHVYDLAGKDTTVWINKTLKKLGEKPVIYDSLSCHKTAKDLKTAMYNKGYMNAEVAVNKKYNKKKIRLSYVLNPGKRSLIGNVFHDIRDEKIMQLLKEKNFFGQGLKKGMPFDVDRLEQERKRITSFLLDNGYYKFNKDYISYLADSLSGRQYVNLTLVLNKYIPVNKDTLTLHPQYYIRTLNYTTITAHKSPLRPKVLRYNTLIKTAAPYNYTDVQNTYHNLSGLRAIRYTNIKFTEVPDTSLLDCTIITEPNKKQSLSFLPEGTNTAGDLGAALSVIYENRNVFRGSEHFRIQFRGAFEAISQLEGYQGHDYKEYGVESRLSFPKLLTPFSTSKYKRLNNAETALVLGWNFQNRPEFRRRVLSMGWRYNWTVPQHNLALKYDLFDLNYVLMPWISKSFKENYLDNVGNRNSILRYNYENLFITKTGFELSFNNKHQAIKLNVETSGNLLDLMVRGLKWSKVNDKGQYTLFNIAYAQYAKFDLDYTGVLVFDQYNTLAFHMDLGIAYPYGNSRILPFEKRYFSGGANSVRGWGVRRLGPGKFKGTDGRIDFINQTGDMKLDVNLEYRTSLFWKIKGAAYIDAGNIWTIRDYPEQPGGQFLINQFYKQIAVSYGLGLRLNLDYLILRFDTGMKAINPAYDDKRQHYPILDPDFARDFQFHFAVGMPF